MAQQLDPKFDPYWEWLKIPPDQQPPNHYRLLGLKPFEADPPAIENAVNRLVEKLQRLSQGPKVESAQKILNQVAQARLCFSDPQKKKAYDSQLKSRLSNSPTSSATASQVKEPTASTTGKPPLPPKADQSGAQTRNPPAISKQKQESSEELDEIARKIHTMKLATAGMLVLGSVFGVFFVWFLFGGKPSLDAKNQVSQGSAVSTPSGAASAQKSVVASDINQLDPSNQLPLNRQAPSATQSPPTTDGFAEAAKMAAEDLGLSAAANPPQPEGKTSSPPTVALNTTSGNPPAQTDEPGALKSPVNGPPTSTATPAPTENPANSPSPSDRVPEIKSGLQALPDQPGTYAPSKSSDFADQIRTVLGLQGKVVMARTSTSGKTNYLMFSANKNELIEVRAKARAIALSEFEKFVGKTIRVRGELKEEFGSKIIGLEIEALGQIEVIE